MTLIMARTGACREENDTIVTPLRLSSDIQKILCILTKSTATNSDLCVAVVFGDHAVAAGLFIGIASTPEWKLQTTAER